MSDILQQAITAIEAGNRGRGERLLTRLVEAEPDNEIAWFWLARVADSVEHRRTCLERVLALNPQHQEARDYLAALLPALDQTPLPVQTRRLSSVEFPQVIDPASDVTATLTSPSRVSSSTPSKSALAPSNTPDLTLATLDALKRLGKYEIKDVLGQGGMGKVYRGYHSALAREVAIKLIHSHLAQDAKFVALFRSEARVVAGMRHPGIVQVYDLDVAENAFYMVMEFVPGESLQQHLATIHVQGGRLPLDKALLLFHTITAAVAYAHEQGVVHRDLKPANVLLTRSGQPILVDFGLSKIVNQPALKAGAISGTPAYMSPEQGAGEETDARTDVYALGVMLYELTTGALPFSGHTPLELILKHIREPLLPPRVLNPDLPQVVEQVIQKALAKNPTKRYASAQALLRDLEEIVWPHMGFGPILEKIVSVAKPFTGQNPYRGLRPFTENEAEFFFGRTEAVQQLLEIVRRLAQAQATPQSPHLMTILGPSGSGKSSLVRAGLIPALWAGPGPGRENWLIKAMTPGPQPLASLAEQLGPLIGREGAELRPALASDSTTLLQLIGQILEGSTENTFFVLVVDQFEEVFTLTETEAERRSFLEQLLQVAHSPRRHGLIILTMRVDFYARAAAYKELAEVITRNQKLVSPLTEAELREAILLPAEAVGLRLEQALVEALLADTAGAAGVLPLLQHALFELFERRDGHILTLAAYRDIGGVQGALARRADKVIAGLTTEQQQLARRIFLRLVRLGEDTADTRRQAAFAEVLSEANQPGEVETVVQTLADANLIITGRQPETGQVILEVAHEALIQAWPQLQRWLDEDRQGLHLRQRLSLAVQEWQARGQDESSLYRGARLLEVEEWMATRPGEINPLEQIFIAASIAAREREQAEREAQRQRELEMARQLAAEQQRRAEEQAQFAAELRQEVKRAEAQARLARAGRWAAQSQLAATNLTDRAGGLPLLLARQAVLTTWAIDPGEDEQSFVTAAADAALRLALATASPWRMTLPRQQHIDTIEMVAFSPTGQMLVTASADGTARLWSVATGRLMVCLAGHTDQVKSAVFSPDGEWVVTSSWDGTARLWEVSTGQEIQCLAGHSDRVVMANFSPDGRMIGTAGWDGTARLWEVSTGAEIRRLTGHTGYVSWVAFSPNGRSVATASADGTARVWNVATGELLFLLAGHASEVSVVAFSPDSLPATGGQKIVTAGHDGVAQLWLAATGQKLRRLAGHTAGVLNAAFSPNAQLLVTTSTDRTARLWEVETGQEIRRLAGHTGAVHSAAFSPDGQTVVTVSQDNSLRYWSVATGQELRRPGGHPSELYDATFSPDGQIIVTAGADQTVRLWQVATGQEIRRLIGHAGAIYAAAFSPDTLPGTGGRMLVTASADQTARLWEVETGQEIRRFIGHAGAVYAAAFSPDQQMVVTAGADQTARLWQVATGQEIRRLTGHTAGVLSAAFSPNTLSGTGGRMLVTASADQTARLWEVETGQEIQRLTGHTGAVHSAAWSANTLSGTDGQMIVTAGQDSTLRCWDPGTGQELRRLAGHTGEVYKVALSPDGQRMISAGADQTARFWDLTTGRETGQLAGHLAAVRAAAFSPDGQLVVTASTDRTSRVWSGVIKQQVDRLVGHGGAVRSAAFSPNILPDTGGHLVVTASADQTARLWDMVTGREIRCLKGHTGGVTGAAFGPAGTPFLITSGEDGTVRLWGWATGEEQQRLVGHMGRVNSAVFSPDGQLILTAGWDNTSRLWAVETGREIQRLTGHLGSVAAAAFSPDGRLVVTAGADRTARVWMVETGQEIRRLTGHQSWVVRAAFSPGGQLVVTAGADRTARLWAVETGQEIQQFVGHTAGVNGATLSPDTLSGTGGHRLATAGTDGTVRLWAVATGQEIQQLSGHTARVNSVAFSPNARPGTGGPMLLTASDDGTARLWLINPDQLLQQAEALIQREPPHFTPAERQHFGLDDR